MNSFQRRGWVIVLVTVAMVLSSVCAVSAMEQVNINTASVEQLMELDRVGAKYAQRIVEYRETVGPFEKPEDIMNVKGIGEKTWNANKSRIVV
jgi:competence protein ComEA